jgi:ESS family glutamate:Na+ symporter
MEIPFVFEPFLGFGAIGIFLVIGVVLRAKVHFFQYFLLPSCLVGGTLGCIAINLKMFDLPFSLFENFAYHFLNIAFISVGLTRGEKHDETQAGGKRVLKGALWMALMKGITWPLQAIIGLTCVLVFGMFGKDLFSTFGLLLPIGFNEGPGQALSIGKVYAEFGFQNAVTVGLTFAVVGYLFCFFVGMPLVKRGLSKGSMKYGKKSLSEDFLKGIMPKEKEDASAGKLTLHTENIDNLSFQLGLVGVIYIITYFFCDGIVQLLPAQTGKILWGFFFAIGMVIAVLFRFLMNKAGVANIIDPGIQRRITGFGIDIMITATLMAIQLGIVWTFIVPIMVISIPSGIITLLSILYFGKRMHSMKVEHTIVTYGMYTGQMSTGLLLLRMVDPEFKSPMLVELGAYPFLVFPFTAVCMVLATLPLSYGLSIVQMIGCYTVVLLVTLVLLKVTKLWGDPEKLF